MKKRIVLAIAATVAVALLCAGLPGLTAILMDKKGENTPVFSNIHPAEQETGEQSVLQKLWLHSNGKSVDIKPANATKTEDEIKKCMEAFLNPCCEAGVCRSVTFRNPTLTTKLIYDVNNPSQTMIVWEYQATDFQTAADGQYFGETWLINAIVDDQSGKVISLRVDHYIVDEETGKTVPFQLDYYNMSYSAKEIWEQNKKRIEPLMDLYFAQLGLSEAAKAVKTSPENYEYLERDTGVTEAHYTFADSARGVKINFSVNGADTFRITVEKLKA